jgi:succinate dehydrogenase/fumarate reductase flavoprotein subunit
MKRNLSFIIVAALALVATSVVSAQTGSPRIPFERTVTWDCEYDVVVVGFGGAGATTAIAAADAGAKVLLLEKAPEGEEGGNTRYAAQIVLCPKDREKAITYFKAMRGGYTNQSDEMIELIVDGSMANRAYVMSLGAKKLVDFPLIEYPELPGADGINTFVFDGEVWTSKLWQLLKTNVESRSAKIDVWYSSPATSLIQDPERKIIHGVKVATNGTVLNVRAKGGVVLATGGFENNIDMIQNYVQMPYAYSKGAKYNTGDGIKMAMKVAADLWHMSTLSGPDVNFKAPGMPTASFGYGIQNPTTSLGMFTGVTGRSVIMVGSDGTRFVNESSFPSHGHINNHGTWISMPIPTPAYMILDETARKAGPLYTSWSKDNSEELAKGYLVSADTIAGLAAKIKVPAAKLEKQVATYNQYCADKVDPVFGRDPKYLKPLETGPYYAIALVPTFTNTQGGPKRNVSCEVLDLDGKAIPHLYSAGELGSFYADIYNGGGNLSEDLFTGRIAGKNASKVKFDVTADSLVAKTDAVASATKAAGAEAGSKASYTLGANEYLGKSKLSGMGGPITVKVRMDGKKIAAIEVLEQTESKGISDKALVAVPAAIIAKQSTQVDVVSGASMTSRSIMSAVQEAVSKVK